MNGTVVIALAIIAIVIVLLFKYRNKFKGLPSGSFVSIVGGVKCGKSTYAVYTAIKTYRKNLIRYYITRAFKKQERPLLYSNIPLKVPYVPITKELLLRQKRFNYKSVILMDEASLIADSMAYKDQEINDSLLDMCKLIGHETRGGVLIYDTHCVNDLHYAFKRTTSTVHRIYKMIKWIPFILIAKVRESTYTEDNTAIQVDTTDIEDTTRMVIIPKNIWKKFDAYCFSAITDELDNDENVVKTDNLKAKSYVSFRKKAYEENKKNKKNN